jgi:hypothetical protein
VKRLLLIAYEYHGYHSKGGAALSRRVKQVADSFNTNGWEITVIHKDQRNETENNSFCIKVQPEGIKRIVVKQSVSSVGLFDMPVLSKLFSLYCLLYKGDRTYKWATDVIKNLEASGLSKPDLIISFFTPRSPLMLGKYFSEYFNVPWIADFQDEVDQGTLSTNRYFTALTRSLSHIWMRKTLSSAAAIVQVSPEWAKTDGIILSRAVTCVRHAIGHKKEDSNLYNENADSDFQIFYGGSIELANQQLTVLNTVLTRVKPNRPVKLVVAGAENIYQIFRANLDHSIKIEYKGWLDAAAYNQCLLESHCCLIIPWSEKNRQVIPSKFYEVCTLRPVWVVGRDSGAFKTLYNDWGCPLHQFGDVEFNISVLERAINNDYSLMFTLDKCERKPMTGKDLCQQYLRLLN